MFKCIFCGHINNSETAKFCTECGPDVPSNDWKTSEIDLPELLEAYTSSLSDIFFESYSASQLDKFSRKIRAQFKISHDAHLGVIADLEKQSKMINEFASFNFEFNENVLDAYAGHDTHLSFRYTNLSEEPVKVSLFWDDPDTIDRVEFQTETQTYVRPGDQVIIGSTTIFDRIGLKEISGFRITVSNLVNKNATFIASPFTFMVKNKDTNITQFITTNNQISIEGRGVVDASGMGSSNQTMNIKDIYEPRWKNIPTKYIHHQVLKSKLVANAANSDISVDSLSKEEIEKLAKIADELSINLEELKLSHFGIQIYNSLYYILNKLDDTSDSNIRIYIYKWLLQTCERYFGQSDSNTVTIVTNYAVALFNDHRFEHIVELLYRYVDTMNDQDRNILGYTLMQEGKHQNFYEAEKYLSIAAENGYSYAISNLGDLYSGENDLNDEIKAEYWYKIGVNNHDNYDRRQLAIIYFNKCKYDESLQLLNDAAKNNDTDALNLIKECGRELIDHGEVTNGEKWLLVASLINNDDTEIKDLLSNMDDQSRQLLESLDEDELSLGNTDEDEHLPYVTDYSDDIISIVNKYKSHLKSQSIYISPRKIPDNKIVNILNTYGYEIASPKDIILLYDNTVFGSAKDGFALTTDKLYIHNMYDDNKSISITDIARVKLKKPMFRTEIHINDELVIQLNIDANDIATGIYNVLNSIRELVTEHYCE